MTADDSRAVPDTEAVRAAAFALLHALGSMRTGVPHAVGVAEDRLRAALARNVPADERTVRSGVGRGFPRVNGRCPACRASSLFLAVGEHVTCASLSCPDPTAAADYLDRTVEQIAAEQDGARDVPAGRDLTAKDVRNTQETWTGGTAAQYRQYAADYLNRIARGDQR